MRPSIVRSKLMEAALRPAKQLRFAVNTLAALAIVFCAFTPAFAQGGFSLPAWLQSYPDAKPMVSSTDSSANATYTVDAQPAEIVAHYRKLFEAQGLAFQPNPDGMGTSIRVEAQECNLLILIRRQADGTFTHVYCTAKSEASSVQGVGSPGFSVDVVVGRKEKKTSTSETAGAPQGKQGTTADKANGEQKEDSGPALEWPSWLVHIRGVPLKPQRGMDSTNSPSMTVEYVTPASLNELIKFYRNLMIANSYKPELKAFRGHTPTGQQLNADGDLVGINYLNGHSGPFTEIEVVMQYKLRYQEVSNSITVTIRVSTHIDQATKDK